jgi:hypothetical protein
MVPQLYQRGGKMRGLQNSNEVRTRAECHFTIKYTVPKYFGSRTET